MTPWVMSEASLSYFLNERNTEAASFSSYKNIKVLNVDMPHNICAIKKGDLSMTQMKGACSAGEER